MKIGALARDRIVRTAPIGPGADIWIREGACGSLLDWEGQEGNRHLFDFEAGEDLRRVGRTRPGEDLFELGGAH